MNILRRAALAVFLPCALLLGRVQAASTLPSIVVIPFQNRNAEGGREWNWISKAIPGSAAAALSASGKFQVVAGEQLPRLFKEIELSETGLADEDSIVERGRSAAVDFVLSGSFLVVERGV